LLERMKFFFYVLKGGFRACVFLKPSTGKTLLAFLAGVTLRVGYKGKKDLFLTDKVVLPSGVRHKVDQLLELGRPLGIRNFDNRYDYHVPHADVAVMEKTVLDRSGSRGFKRLVALNPGGNWGPKRWPEERFVELGNMLAARYPDVGIVVTGAQKDKRAADSIVSAIGPERGFSMAGDTDLRSLAALFRMCSLVVSADSGPMHLASAVGVPVAGIFGPTSSGLTGPRGRGRIVIVQGDAQGCAVPCYEKDCGKGYGCMNGVSAERVFKLVTILG
jgi:lipopolysaccharide heptosyltransferase II